MSEIEMLKALDLFCGLGGWSDGLAMEGFENLGIEINPKIAKLYKHDVVVADVRTLNGENFKGFDLIVGSPPCRDFTILQDKLWKRKKNPDDGLKNVHAFLRIVEVAQPSFWLMENVCGLEKYLTLNPRVSHAPLSPTMKRSFWGNFPLFLIPSDVHRKMHKDTSGFPPLAKWERAKIPLPVARALGKAVRDAIKEN